MAAWRDTAPDRLVPAAAPHAHGSGVQAGSSVIGSEGAAGSGALSRLPALNHPLQRRKLYQHVLDRLMQSIETGELAPGEQLPSERELMESLGVGRVAVREALQELSHRGIVEISHGERARVVVPTAQTLIQQIGEGTKHLLRAQPETLEHLLQARLFLETGMVAMAARQANDAHIARLWNRLHEHRAVPADSPDFLQADMRFHREIAAVSGNPIFPAIIEAMFGWAGAFYQSIVRAPGVEALTLAEHQRIVEAIAARDEAAAVLAMREHLVRADVGYRQGRKACGSTR